MMWWAESDRTRLGRFIGILELDGPLIAATSSPGKSRITLLCKKSFLVLHYDDWLHGHKTGGSWFPQTRARHSTKLELMSFGRSTPKC